MIPCKERMQTAPDRRAAPRQLGYSITLPENAFVSSALVFSSQVSISYHHSLTYYSELKDRLCWPQELSTRTETSRNARAFSFTESHSA